MYYAYDMASRSKNTRRKTNNTPIIIASIVTVCLLVGGYFWYVNNKQRSLPIDKEAYKSLRKEVEQRNQMGDVDLVAEFTAWAEADEIEKAKQVYEDVIAATNDETEQKSLYKQYYVVSLEQELDNNALEIARKIDQLWPSHESKYNISLAYRTLGDDEKESEFLIKAMQAVDSDETISDKQIVKNLYQFTLDSINQRAAR